MSHNYLYDNNINYDYYQRNSSRSVIYSRCVDQEDRSRHEQNLIFSFKKHVVVNIFISSSK